VASVFPYKSSLYLIPLSSATHCIHPSGLTSTPLLSTNTALLRYPTPNPRNTHSSRQCAVGHEGQLLDASQIPWYNDPDDTVPTSSPKEPSLTEVRPAYLFEALQILRSAYKAGILSAQHESEKFVEALIDMDTELAIDDRDFE
jgi:hypothetical protein